MLTQTHTLPNGRSKGHRPEEFDPTQLRRGAEVEREHTTDMRTAQRIAMDHLVEDPLYYEKLAKIHLDGARSALGDVEPYQQIRPYSCGAAALKAVLGHWGEPADERDLIREVGVDPENGASCYQVEAAARKRGYWAQTWKFDSLDELARFTDRDIPVIIAIHSFTRPGEGHFVVATDVKSDRVEVMDPNVKGNQRTLSRRELDKRWKFRDRVGVLVMPPKKRQQFGFGQATDTTTTSATRKRTMFAITGVIILIAAIGAGAVIYRRRQRSTT
jgi:predicted double-glycine peptidase